MKQALILTAWFHGPQDNWYPWLKKQLEKKGYATYVPELPSIHTNEPNLEQMLETVDKTLSIDKETTIIGHSIGCLLAMRIAEIKSFHRMVLVSGWDFNDLTKEHQSFWKLSIDHEKIKQNVDKIYCISSDNDPYCTYFVNEQMADRLGGKTIMVKGAGHFTDKFGVAEVPQIVELM